MSEIRSVHEDSLRLQGFKALLIALQDVININDNHSTHSKAQKYDLLREVIMKRAREDRFYILSYCQIKEFAYRFEKVKGKNQLIIKEVDDPLFDGIDQERRSFFRDAEIDC